MKDRLPGDYEIGHRKPPVASRFTKGTSGNPSGRPKRATTKPSPFDIILERTLTIEKNGEPQIVSAEEALQHALFQKALTGNPRARREVMKMIMRREDARRAAAPPAEAPMMRVEANCSGDANGALILLEIATQTYPEGLKRLKLHTWAVQAAYDRRGPNSPAVNENHVRLRMLEPTALLRTTPQAR